MELKSSSISIMKSLKPHAGQNSGLGRWYNWLGLGSYEMLLCKNCVYLNAFINKIRSNNRNIRIQCSGTLIPTPFIDNTPTMLWLISCLWACCPFKTTFHRTEDMQQHCRCYIAQLFQENMQNVNVSGKRKAASPYEGKFTEARIDIICTEINGLQKSR